MFKSEAYAKRYAEFASSFDEAAWADDEKVLNTRLLPDPARRGCASTPRIRRTRR
jgi:arginine decarboxylase